MKKDIKNIAIVRLWALGDIKIDKNNFSIKEIPVEHIVKKAKEMLIDGI